MNPPNLIHNFILPFATPAVPFNLGAEHFGVRPATLFSHFMRTSAFTCLRFVLLLLVTVG